LARQRAGTRELSGASLRLYFRTDDSDWRLAQRHHGVHCRVATEANGSSKVLPMAELEKQTILGTIAQLNGDKLLAAECWGSVRHALPEAEEYVAQD